MQKNKVAFITGGAQRIGEFLVNHLADSGWDVIVHANNSFDKASGIVLNLQKQFPDQNFDACQYDLKDWKNLDDHFFKRYGDVDLLVNNASVFEKGHLCETSNELLQHQFDVNFFAPFKLTQLFYNNFKKGLVVNILDTKVTTNENVHSAYLLAKKALAEFTKMAALEFAPNCRVNAIAPGPVLPAAIDKEGRFRKAVGNAPLKTNVSLQSIGSALRFLIESDSTTGQVVFCDSGVHLK